MAAKEVSELMKMPIRTIVLSTSLLLIAPASYAQQAVIDHCKQTSSDADRIACLEAAILGRELSDSEPPAPVDPPVDPPVSEPQPEGIGADQVLTRNRTGAERDDALEKDLGLAIASYHWVPYERLVVTLENGQVWRQIKGDTTRIRVNLDRNQTADITESGLGGFRLRLNEIRRTIRVERIK